MFKGQGHRSGPGVTGHIRGQESAVGIRGHGSQLRNKDQGPGQESGVRVTCHGLASRGVMPLGKSSNTYSAGFSACQNSDHFVQNVGNPSQTCSTLTKTFALVEDQILKCYKPAKLCRYHREVIYSR